MATLEVDLREVGGDAGHYKPLADSEEEHHTDKAIRVSAEVEMEVADENLSNKPKNRPYYQQTMRSWSPLLTPWRAVGGYLLIGLIFVPLGAIFWQDSDVVELK